MSYEPPLETRSFERDVALVVIYVADQILDAAVGVSVESLTRKAVAKFKDRLPQVEVEVKDNDLDI